jgi:hypothetical protein
VIRFRPLNVGRDWGWVREHVKCVLCEDTKGVIAERDGEIVGACIADSWAPGSCMGHFAATTPMVWRAGLHKEFFRWVFANRAILIGVTPADKVAAIRMNRHLGFRELTRIPDGFDEGVDYIVFQMRRDECRWIEHETTAENKRTAAA